MRLAERPDVRVASTRDGIEHEGISRRHVGSTVRGRDLVTSSLLALLIVPSLYLQFATALPTPMEA